MSAILKSSYYKPASGGHAPGDLRDAFCEAVEAFQNWIGNGSALALRRAAATGPEPTVELRGRQVPITKVFGLMWNCTDYIGGDLYQWAQDEVVGFEENPTVPGTYGALARKLRAIAERAAA